jgi:[acyl-carrier-protein] S-malonyltransferase
MAEKYQKIAFLFPGQGAQYAGMAKDFFENFAEAREVFEEADDILKRKLSTIILTGPDALLTETRNSQTGIYVACLAILQVIKKRLPKLEPKVCAGLSLGEYTALTASAKVPFDAGLNLVQHRGQFMNDSCEATKGTMAVILGLDGPIIEQMVKEVAMPHDLWAANFNCPGQVVISGTMAGIEAGAAAAKLKGAKRVLPLQVHGAFHSGLMQTAEERLAEYVYNAPLVRSDIGLVMNVTGNLAKGEQEIRTNLIKQVTHPVRWEQCIRSLGEEGVDLFIEIGCGKTLSGFNKRIGLPIPTLSVEKVEELDALAKEVQ